LDPKEPERLARAARELGVRYVVLTSVTRDDLPDGGAGHFARTVAALRRQIPGVRVELLIPDFGGRREAVETVLRSGPDVLNHNIETIERLYPSVRPGADYGRSLGILSAARRAGQRVKSGLMVGLGERFDEVVAVMEDIGRAGCSILTIGQYLRPTAAQMPVESFVEPDVFERYAAIGRGIGFEQVLAGPFVRSSYRAEEVCGRLDTRPRSAEEPPITLPKEAVGNGRTDNVAAREGVAESSGRYRHEARQAGAVLRQNHVGTCDT
jgi:lipoic acid synthetase